MLFALSLLIPLLVLAFWLFWRLSPKGPRVRIFNFAATAVVVLIGLAVAATVRDTMAATTDHAAWPLVAAFYALAVIPAALALAAGLRRLTFGTRTPSKPLEVTRDLTNTRF